MKLKPYVTPTRDYKPKGNLEILSRVLDDSNNEYSRAYRQGYLEIEIMPTPTGSTFISIFPAAAPRLLWTHTIEIENFKLSELLCIALCSKYGKYGLKELQSRAEELFQTIKTIAPPWAVLGGFSLLLDGEED